MFETTNQILSSAPVGTSKPPIMEADGLNSSLHYNI